jgi:hypothetical protein
MSLEISDTDPALAAAVLELETHASEQGWDRPATLYALVDTAALAAREPALAALMGLDDASAAGSLTPVEQEQLTRPLEEVLPSISWPADVAGCAAVVERLVLPPGVDDDPPDQPAAAAEFARNHPARQEVRMVIGVTRAGASYCALRLRAHDEPGSVVAGDELVPELVELLRGTLEEDPEVDQR